MATDDRTIVILDGGRRTPRADILINNREPGLFSRFSTTQLGGFAIAGTLANTKLDRGLVGHVVMGMAQHSHRDSIYAARGMSWRGGLDKTVPALTVARICGSGAESMQYPFTLYGVRGKKLGEAVQKYGPIDAKALPAGTHLQDMLLMSLYDPSAGMAMANTAEELGRRYQITREEADAFGFRSQTRAKAARDAGAFREETVPVAVQLDGASDPIEVVHDTHILDDATLAKMARLPAAFEAGGIVTAGNASAVVDGAGAMVIGTAADAAKHGAAPLARLAGVGVAGCDPKIMGWGPVPSTERALAAAGISGKDIDRVELNEAFAPQALAVIRDFGKLGIDAEKVNPEGGAIALGHPLGATGAILTLTCAYGLRRAKQRYGLVTMCIGGGQGISLVIEAM